MGKYIIRWDAGFGEWWREVGADSIEEARELAYEAWIADAESNAFYDAVAVDEVEPGDPDYSYLMSVIDHGL